MASIQPPTGDGPKRVFYTRNGKRAASPVLPNRAAAEAWMREHLPTLAATTVAELVRIWEAEAPSPHRTEAALRIQVAAAARGWGRIEDLGLAELRAWQRDSSPRYGQYLRTLLRWAASVHGLAVRADALAWKPPTYKRQPPVPLLTDAQAASIRETAKAYGPRAHAIIDYLLTYGARPVTACRLRRIDLEVSRGELVISDAKHSGGWRHAVRDVHADGWPGLTSDWFVEPAPVSTADVPLFPHYIEDRAWKIERGSARELCDWYRNTIGKKLKLGRHATIYHLKRYAITDMLRRGIDPATVALFTGHLDLEQVLTYAKSNADLQRSALALLGGNTDRNTVTPPRAVSPLTP